MQPMIKEIVVENFQSHHSLACLKRQTKNKMQSIILANNDLFRLNNVTICLIQLRMHAHCFNINNSQDLQSNEH